MELLFTMVLFLCMGYLTDRELNFCESLTVILNNWTFDNANQGSMNQEPNLNLNNALIMR